MIHLRNDTLTGRDTAILCRQTAMINMNRPTPPNHFDRRQTRLGAFMLWGVVATLIGLGVRVAYLNSPAHADLTVKVLRQQRGGTLLPARRGMILDASGRIVALSRQTPSVFVDPALVDDVDDLSAVLAVRVSRPADEIAASIRRRANKRYVVVATDVDKVTADAVRAMNHRAVGLTDHGRRFNPLGAMMAHVLGWVGRDGHGMAGVELTFDKHLRGKDGYRATLCDVRRRAMLRATPASRSPIDGGHVVLTIDAEIQRITEKALADSIDRFDAEHGVALVMAPATGEILAMASLPAFDVGEPVLPSNVERRRNRVLTDPVEPGSTFKALIICGALDGGYVTSNERIDCYKGWHYFGKRLIKDTHPNGLLDVRGIITKSSNIGMGIIGHRMGNAALRETLMRFGLGRRTGIDLPGESTGVVYSLRRWTSYSTTSIPMGYEVLVTPLQLAGAFAAIVNDGIRVRPHVVKELVAPNGVPVQSFAAPVVLGRVVSSEVARYVARDLLRSVVTDGGGGKAQIGPYHVLGKTGTAKLIDADRGVYEEGAYLGLFVGAAPASNPELVALVMIRRPDASKGYYGGTVAAPAVGAILAESLAYLGVPPDASSVHAGL